MSHQQSALGRPSSGKKRLKDLLLQSDNRTCADCRAPDPKWASANIGVFICLKCCGIHRSLGTHISKVLSVTLDDWSDDEIESMIEVGGNASANSIYEAYLPEGVKKPAPDAGHDERSKFIRSKYERQEFLKPSLRILSNPKRNSLQTSLSKNIMGSFRTSSSSQKSEGMVEFIGMLKVKIIKGTNMAIRDMLSSDPYVVLTLGQQKVQTTVVKSNLNPVWNEDLMLSVPQDFGAVKLGENPKKPGNPHNVRLYSIASTRYGDYFDGRTASFCVRRAVYYDPETGKEDPSKNGVCSNFLCDSKPGDKVQITGPSGKIMLLPEDNPNATHIMIATGTGVAPYRGYLRRMFMESVPTFKFGGLAWLFLGVANSDSLLYDDEFTKYLQDYPDHFRYDRALSREQKNKTGGKMYVQDKIEEYSDEIFKLLDNGAHIYFCGLKGMMPGIQDTLKRVAEQRGESWDEKLSQLKKKKQWHVEVY